MLELKDIRYTVQDEGGSLDILKGVSLTVPDHKLMVFTGPNGGGKTTLAKVIMGLVQPTSGQILWNGQDITNLSITERARLGISYGFQQPPPVQGTHRPGSADHRLRRPEAHQGQVLPVPDPRRSVRQRLSGPGGGRVPLRR